MASAMEGKEWDKLSWVKTGSKRKNSAAVETRRGLWMPGPRTMR